MEWAAEKAGLIPKNDDDAMAMRMVIGETHTVRVMPYQSYVILMLNTNGSQLKYPDISGAIFT